MENINIVHILYCTFSGSNLLLIRLGGAYPGLGELVPRPVDGTDLVLLLLLLLSAAKAGGLLVHMTVPRAFHWTSASILKLLRRI